MKIITNKIKEQLKAATIFMENSSTAELEFKISPDKWSKKEILGHLIDSAINNLQRFTEIQFTSQPYVYRAYKQSELVKANGYNESPLNEILSFWQAINQRIIHVIEKQDKDSLALKIDLGEGKIVDLQFLITDYVDHMEYHLKQIMA